MSTQRVPATCTVQRHQRQGEGQMNNLIDRYKLCIPRRLLAMLLLGTALAFAGATTVSAQDTDGLSLITNTPEEGFALAVKLSQKGVATVQPDAEVRKGLRNS
ncbi:MAG TPA: hexameric tyrosine-coordinated heme protein, partial [Salinisphaeraceae bacterium]|nr:hexameric tyrosine-coordinated heme protein [Salinisphaeraceae bacterium]